MDWKEYEKITKGIYEKIGASSGVSIECYGAKCKVKGKSLVEHQVDVLTLHSDGFHDYRTAIECKYWNENINKDIIMKVAEIVEDAGLQKGVIVSKLGFTPDAIAFAKYKRVGLVELRPLVEDDWVGRIRDIHFQIAMVIPEITSMDIVLPPGSEKRTDKWRGQSDYLYLEYADGRTDLVLPYLQDFYDELSKKTEGEQHEKTYSFADGTKLVDELAGEEISLEGFIVKGVVKIAKTESIIRGEDHVQMVLKLIFEEKEFTYRNDGSIILQEKLK